MLCSHCFREGPVYYKGEQAANTLGGHLAKCSSSACLCQVAVLNGTVSEYKVAGAWRRGSQQREKCASSCEVDIWSGAHPAWKGQKGKELLAMLRAWPEYHGMHASHDA